MAFGIPYAANLQLKSTNAGTSVSVASVGLYSNPERTKEFAFYNQATDARVGYLGYQYGSGSAITDLTLLNALAGALIFGTNNTEDMRLTSAGALGLGTTAPNKTGYNSDATVQTIYGVRRGILELGSDAPANSDTVGSVDFLSSTTNKAYVRCVLDSSANGQLTFGTNNTERARMTSGGNLLIGTTDGTMYDTNAGADVSQFYKFISTGGGTSQAYGFTVSNGGGDAAMGIWGVNSASKRLRIAGILSQYTSSTAGSEASVMTFSTMGSGVLSERARIDSSGNMGIGTSNPVSRLNVSTGEVTLVTYTSTRGSGSYNTYAMGTSGTILGYIGHAPQLVLGSSDNQFAIRAETSLLFATGGANERGRFDSSGNFLVGKTSTADNVAGFKVNQTGLLVVGRANADPLATIRFDSNGDIVTFYRGTSNVSTTQVGSVSVTTTATAYNTSSDYRLKNITGNLTGYKERLMSLQPKQGTWKVDGSEFRGFLAHEFANPYSASVTGEKDAVDENGNPMMQSMQASSSEVMADLVAMVKELVTENASLKARLDAANL
jgi:hypothetical protein